MRSGLLLSAFLAIVGSGCVNAAMAADTWPEHTVRIIVPFPAGGAVDIAARILAEGLAKRWDRTVVVENKPGGETTIGVTAFVGARDNHTLLYTTFGTLSVAPLTVDKLPFDPKTDLVPLVPVASIVVGLAVTNALSVKTLAELEAAIRAKPGQFAWSSAPTLPRYAFATFLKQRGLEMNFVAYRDNSQPQADLGEDRIQALITALPASASVVSSGKARLIAITEPRRSRLVAEVPTASEAGYDELTFIGGVGLFGWKDMPEGLRNRIVADTNTVLTETAAAERLKATGQQVIGGGPDILVRLIDQQTARVLEMSKSIDLKSAR
jgi:tripartite-type tricarboxylate transporter receptor subunit TctC